MRFKEFNKTPIGIDPEYYKKLAQIESSNNPLAQASTSSAAGLFQFTEGTWKDIIGRMGKDYTLEDRFDPNKSKEAVEYFTKINSRYLQNKIGEEPNEAELYLAHFLGMGASSSLLSALREDPNKSVADVVSKNAIEANKSVFLTKQGQPKTVKDVYNWSAKKFGVPTYKVKKETLPRSDVYRQAERPEAVVENTQTIIDERINLYTPLELTTFVDESEVTMVPSKQEEPEKKEPKATQKAKQELEKKKAEERFLSDILSGGVRAEVEQEQPAPEAQQPVQPFGSFIIPKAQELGIFQDGGITVDELKNSPINKGDEMAEEGRQFLEYWMNSARFKNKLKENILEADSLERDPRYQGFIDQYLFDIDEDTERVREEALEALNETAVYGNDISSKDKDKLSKAYQDLYGETDGSREVRERLVYGLHNSEGNAVWLNRREDGIPIHELTHSTDLDGLMSKIAPNSKIYNETLDTFKQRYPDREDLNLSLGGLRGPNVGGLVRSFGILPPRYKTVANKEDIENVLDSLSKRDGKNYDIGGLRYMNSSKEVYPRIMSIRKRANLKPDEVIDDERMEEIYERTKDGEELYRYYDKEQVKEMLNKFAGVENNQNNLNVAKKGGEIKENIKKYPDGGTAPKQPEDPEYTLQFPYINLQAPYLYPPKTQQRQVQEAFLNWYKDPATTQRLQEVHGLSPEETEQYLTRGVEGVIKEGTPGARDAKAQFYTGSGDIVTTDLSDIPLNVHEITHRSELDERLAGPLVDILGKPSGVFRKVKNYLSEPTEAYGNFVEFRGRLGVQPGERIDEAKFDKLVKEKGLTEENFYRAFDKEKIIKALNTVAFTDRLQQNNAQYT